MGLFSVFPCFKTSKHRKLKKSVNPTTSFSSVDQGDVRTCDSVLNKVPTEESTNLGSLQNPLSKSRDSNEDHLINDSDDKPVTIDTDVEAKVDISIEEVEILSVESKEDNEKNTEEIGKLGFLVQLENEKERVNEANKDDEELGNVVQIEDEKEKKKEERNSSGIDGDNENKNEAQSLIRACSDSSVSSYISYPPMHRYHNCVINEEEEDEDDVLMQEDSSESLFSLSINPRRLSKSCPVEFDDKEVNSPLKTKNDRNHNHNHNQSIDNSLLNPIENFTQWKTLIPKPIPAFNPHQQKENVYSQHQVEKEEEDTHRSRKVKKDGDVATSLSSWLIEPDNNKTSEVSDSQVSVGNSCAYSEVSDSQTSWKSFEDRPILGAWSIDEVRHVSARSSPRKSPCKDLDELPIIGSVGSYWNHTGSSSSFSSPLGKPRRNREKKASSCHSTPVKTRVERSLDKSAV